MITNSLVLLGRLNNIPVLKDGKATIEIKLNETGELFDLELEGSMAENVIEYCRKDDILGIRGHLKSDNKVVSIVVEKVTFLASKSRSEEE